MEDMLDLFEQSDAICKEWSIFCEDMKLELRSILWGAAAAALPSQNVSSKSDDNPYPSPQQTKKRAKRLTSLAEDDDTTSEVRGSLRISNAKLFAAGDPVEETRKSTESAALPKARTKGGKSQTQQTVKTPSNDDDNQNSLMPPPAVPAAAQHNASTVEEHSFVRPQRAAKLKSEKNLKEPKLNVKMRQPSVAETTKVKLEHEQRASQLHAAQSAKTSLGSNKSDDTVIVLPEKPPSLVELSDEEEEDEHADKENNINKDNEDTQANTRQLRVKVKKEKFSISQSEKTNTTNPQINQTNPIVRKPNETVNESASTTSILSATTTGQGKRNRKKKEMPLPITIKVERLSGAGDEASDSPISSRTRHGSIGRVASTEEEKSASRSPSIYEDAVDKGSTANQQEAVVAADKTTGSAKVNETVSLPNANDATFCTNAAQTTFQVTGVGQTTFVMSSGGGGGGNPNATVTLDKKPVDELVDATFNVPAAESRDEAEQQQSFVTAKHSMDTARNDDSLLTDDDSDGGVVTPVPAPQQLAKPMKVKNKPEAVMGTKLPLPGSAKFFKMPTRTNELFNPLVQSPVKKKVEAFENAVAEQKSGRNKNSKDNMSSLTTPQIGKLHAPALGRFLTPTQASNVTPNMMAAIGTKKAPNSASKAMAFPKLYTASNLKSTNSTSTKTLTRENSADDMRKGINQLTEERKRQREQKHLLAAQQREAKERERAERLAKLAKEREEKRLKKQQEAELKKRELEEIQRKLRQPEEAAAEAARKAAASAKNKAIMDQERELLQQMKMQQQQSSASTKNKMLPPPPRIQMEYNFEMLHEDDSTDDETKTSYKRPPPPTWSRRHVRGAAILMQQYWPTSIIDSFFSVQPTTPDLREIFPDIKESYLKRNSSVLWSTPPRYSELPKY